MEVNAASLLDYLAVTNENSNEHANEHPQLMPLVLQMDKIFQDEIFGRQFNADPMSGFLAMNSYTLLLSSVRQALSGHLSSIFPVNRTALESACYAYLIAHKEGMRDVWLNRHTSRNALDKCRKEFSVKKASNELKSLYPEMAQFVMHHYEAAIDYGAHPNEKSVLSHLTNLGEVDNKMHGFEFTAVYEANSWHVNLALLICTDIGQAIAFLLAACTDEHPLLHDRLKVFTDWLDEKNHIVEKFGGESLDYSGPMYCSMTPPV